eukprot:scaffold25241_cov101-Isochrysis_galbana.AAC.1
MPETREGGRARHRARPPPGGLWENRGRGKVARTNGKRESGGRVGEREGAREARAGSHGGFVPVHTYPLSPMLRRPPLPALSFLAGTGRQRVAPLSHTQNRPHAPCRGQRVRTSLKRAEQQARAHLGDAGCSQHERQPGGHRRRLVHLAVARPEELPPRQLQRLVPTKLGCALQPVANHRRPQAVQQCAVTLLAHHMRGCSDRAQVGHCLHAGLDVIQRHDQ